MQAAKFPRIPTVALTATATGKVKTDILSILGMSGCPVFTVCLPQILNYKVCLPLRCTLPGLKNQQYADLSFLNLQVSFFRSNLILTVVKKPKGRTPDGEPAELDALVKYIK